MFVVVMIMTKDITYLSLEKKLGELVQKIKIIHFLTVSPRAYDYHCSKAGE